MPISDRIPVFFLSGFLGAGKSTLLNELLVDPSFSDTAVIINEFGDVAIDHLLVRQGKTTISQVSTRCMCCTGTTDLRTTLFDMYSAAQSGLTPRFSRVIVEMSGLGDPAPLINALMVKKTDNLSLSDSTVNQAFQLSGFVTLYDIINGEISIERHFEALKQVAFADRIILTKTDLAKDPATLSDIAVLPQTLKAINPSAAIVDRQKTKISELFSPRTYSVSDRREDVEGWLALEDVLATQAMQENANSHSKDSTHSRHASGIRTFSIIHDEPIPEKRFTEFMSTLQTAAGPKLLRMKGIIGVTEDTEHPRLVHAVQHCISDPVRLAAWPDHDRRTRFVFITNEIDPKPVHDLFSAIIGGAAASRKREQINLCQACKQCILRLLFLFKSKRREEL
ncbi:CobW family GTP-binding protein [Ahrensia marina]|uniref:CobW family GTP-binding protein n=1 Tax=Ahrensia marina TaxID=1514904 RepID=UPI0006B66BDA|nr:GTP-binding protein [Ahrensia marina]